MSIVGPFITNRPWPQDSEVYFQAKYKWVGLLGTRPPLPYGMTRCVSTGIWNVLNCANVTSNALDLAGTLEGKAYDKFWDTMQKRASLGLTLVDGRKSLSMVARRFQQLTNLVKAVRRLDVTAINRILKVSPRGNVSRRSRKGDSKTFANLWLEYTFGWVPLLQDIYSSCQVLSQNFGFVNHKVKVFDSKSIVHPWDGGPHPGDSGSQYAMIADSVFTCGATVRITNPNVNLANQLGLLNPAYILWDAVPWSYVLDWVAPFGKFLRRLSNGLGLEVSKAWRQASSSVRGYTLHSAHGRRSYPCRGVQTVRSLGLPTPPTFLSGVKFPHLDPWLAATSLALFVQQFKFGH